MVHHSAMPHKWVGVGDPAQVGWRRRPCGGQDPDDLHAIARVRLHRRHTSIRKKRRTNSQMLAAYLAVIPMQKMRKSMGCRTVQRWKRAA
eukprot:7385377-Prymnesium_polylepis.2